LLELKAEINNVAMLISTNTSQGKTKHPGLHYFNAKEWFQFAEMHVRHQLGAKRKDGRIS
jgi:protein associated with RNAse G/E